MAKFVKDPFTDDAEFDWETYKEVVRIFTRMLDNVVEVNGLPLEGQRREITTKRRHGMGFLGLGSALSLLGEQYGNDFSVEFTEELMKVMAVEGFKVGVDLAKEKGPAPIFEESTNGVSNKELWCSGNYMAKIWKVDPELKDEAMKVGCRFTHHTSIAPTGTISLSLNDNCCVAKGTIVRTDQGDIPIEEVTLDHKVLSHVGDGKFEFRELEFAGMTRPNTEVFEIELENGMKLEATYDHKFYVLDLHDGEFKYVELQELMNDVDRYEVANLEKRNYETECPLCSKSFKNRNGLIRHMHAGHGIHSSDFQYVYEGHNKCKVCNANLDIKRVKDEYRPGRSVADMHCSKECSKLGQARTFEYFVKHYGLDVETAKKMAKEERKCDHRFKSQIGYWTKRGLSVADAKIKVSEFQNQTSLESFVGRHGPEEGPQKYAEYTKKRAERSSGENNPMYGKQYTDDERIAKSQQTRLAFSNERVIDNIVNGINNGPSRRKTDTMYHETVTIVGKNEPIVWEILDEMGISHKPQYAIKLTESESKELDRRYVIYDLYLPDLNLIIEINEDWHSKTREWDVKKLEAATKRGFIVQELWVTSDMKTQIKKILEKVGDVS